MELAFGFTGAMVIGILLGLLGGGGSTLAVPVLVYFFQISPVYATAYSLFIVGVASLTGSLACMKQGLVNYKTAFIFGVPSVLSVYLTRKMIIPAIPEHILTVGEFEISKNMGIMALFAVLMILAAVPMIRKRQLKEKKESDQKGHNYPLIILEGAVVGLFTGLVGAGGGFLIIPALVLLSNIPIKMAVGTSLLIISMKSLIGFTGDISNLEIDWGFLLGFTGVAMAGILLGNFLSKFISPEKLKPAFGWFVLVMGLYIIGTELFYN